MTKAWRRLAPKANWNLTFRGHRQAVNAWLRGLFVYPDPKHKALGLQFRTSDANWVYNQGSHANRTFHKHYANSFSCLPGLNKDELWKFETGNREGWHGFLYTELSHWLSPQDLCEWHPSYLAPWVEAPGPEDQVEADSYDDGTDDDDEGEAGIDAEVLGRAGDAMGLGLDEDNGGQVEASW